VRREPLLLPFLALAAGIVAGHLCGVRVQALPFALFAVVAVSGAAFAWTKLTVARLGAVCALLFLFGVRG
jgi:hypothetical protein